MQPNFNKENQREKEIKRNQYQVSLKIHKSNFKKLTLIHT